MNPLLRRDDSEINEAATVFFVVLLTLIITLYDRFDGQRVLRAAEATPPPEGSILRSSGLK